MTQAKPNGTIVLDEDPTHFHSFYHCSPSHHTPAAHWHHFVTWLGQRINVLRVGMSQAFVIGWVSLCLVPLPASFPIRSLHPPYRLNFQFESCSHGRAFVEYVIRMALCSTINKNNHASIGSSAIGTLSNTSVTLFRYHDYLSLLKGLYGTTNNQRFELAKRTYYGFLWSVAHPLWPIIQLSSYSQLSQPSVKNHHVVCMSATC